jgi:PDDEXK-like domain of unknown function (DUF3799)
MAVPAIHPDIPEAEYHADRGSLSHSGAKLLLPPSVPAKFREAMDNPPPPKKAFDFGHLAHGLVLGKGVPLVVLYPEVHGLKKDGQVADSPTATATWKAAVADARAAGKLPVHADDYCRAAAMQAVVSGHPVAGPLFANGTSEQSIYADDPTTGVCLRGRVDTISALDGRPVIGDYKTTASAARDRFERYSAKYMYHLQAAWYLDLAALLGIKGARFLLIAQEDVPPYLVSVLEPDDEAIAEGRRLKRQAIETYSHCTETGEWPGYPEEILSISLPLWAVSEMEMEI